MSRERWVRLLIIVALLGAYGYRTAGGLRAGWAFDRGHMYRNMGNYPDSVAQLERAAVGENLVSARLMAGEVRLDLWEADVRWGGPLGADEEDLVDAAEDFLTCRCEAPGARRGWKGLAEVYDALEWIGRERRAEVPYTPPKSPWERVGRPGRVAIGMLRMAEDVAPSWSRLYDRLAITFWNYGFDEPTREAVRASARALPVYYRHPYPIIPELPSWVATEFAAASREMLGRVPLFPRADHLIDLGKLERSIGDYDRAIATLTEALDGAKDETRRAEASFHLGLAEMAVGRLSEAREHLEVALEHRSFRASVLGSLARLAEMQEDYPLALEHLRQLRWERPGELWPCLEFADVAGQMGDWDAALEALRWARLKHADDPRPLVALAEVSLEMNDLAEATTAVDELENLAGESTDQVKRFRREIARALNGGGRGAR